MALLGASAHNLLRTHLNSSLVQDSQALVTCRDTTTLRRTAGARTKLGYSEFSTNYLSCFGEKFQSESFRVRNTLNRNGSATTSVQQAETADEVETEVEKRFTSLTDTMTSDPSCPLPDIVDNPEHVTLLDPLMSPLQISENSRPLLLYVPGMDCTGQGLRRQLSSLVGAGYGIRCLFTPSDDRSTWIQLVQKTLSLLEKELTGTPENLRHLTVVGESFGGCLAIRLAQAAPHIVSRLILINPATNFTESNTIASFCARTGLLAAFPEPLYEVAQDIMLPLMVRRERVSREGNEDMLSPIDYVPAQCAAWRFSMLNDTSGLSDKEIRSIEVPTLLFASAKDRILTSATECLRLQSLLPNAKRVIMPESGHTLLLEDSINLACLMERNGFTPPVKAPSFSSSRITGGINSPLHSDVSDEKSNHLQRRKHAVPDERYDEMGKILEPWRILTSPLVSGADTLPNPDSEPRRPLLFVGNHTMFGIYDSPILVYELFTRGFRVRGLAHPGHWATGVGAIFERYGNVKASKFSAYKLLKDGEDVLLFPGGAREVCKRKGEEYKLMWKPAVDFVRMASRLNAIIVPFGILGADDAYNILVDGDDILKSPVGPLIEAVYDQFKIGTENIYPLTTLPVLGLPSLIPIPSIERIYIHFANPIDTADFKLNINDRDKCKEMYVVVRQRVEDAIDHLKQIRENDPERSLAARLMGKATRLLPERKP